jgi:RNA polymerase sigma factor (sigma-70 family)
MPNSAMTRVMYHLRQTVQQRNATTATDSHLLACFLANRDEDAFAALVRRHGPMVWGVCRRVVGNQHDAEDAFQATFLILLRKAALITSRELLANWLYGVAQRTALHARTLTLKRRLKERQVPVMPDAEAKFLDRQPDWQSRLDEELSRLPDKYRAVVVLCDLKGKTRKEVARQLSLPEGTVAGRLARARAKLADRLKRHGVTVSSGLLATLLAQSSATACVPAALLRRAVNIVNMASSHGALPVHVVALTNQVLGSMQMTKFKIGTSLLLLALVVSSAGLLGHAAARPAALAAPLAPLQGQAPAGKASGDSAKQPPLPAAAARLQVEHNSPVLSIAWSASGAWIATGTKDGAIHLTDTASGKEMRKIAAGDAVIALAFAPDGKAFVVGQSDGTVSVWATENGQQLSKRKKPINKNAPGELMAFTPDGQAVVTVGLGTFSEFKANLQAGGGMGMGAVNGVLAMAPDGSVGGWVQDGEVVMRAYDPMAQGQGSKQIQRLQIGDMRGLAFAPGGKLLAVGTDDKGVALWDLTTKNKSTMLVGLAKPATKLVFSGDGRALAALAGDGASIRVWDLAKKKTLGEVHPPRGTVSVLALSPDGKLLATAGVDDKVLVVWKVSARELTHKGPPLELSAQELAELWTDLGSPDYEKADDAWRKLGAGGDPAISFLAKKIRAVAVPEVDMKAIDKMVADLDDASHPTREKAAKGLADAGEAAIVPLQRLVEKPPSLEAAKRAETILRKLGEPALTPDRLRALEVIDLLEQLRTPNAIALLQEIERDALVAPLRSAARQALQRLVPQPRKGLE